MLELVKSDDPILHRRVKGELVSKVELIELVQELIGVMLVEGGVGLAANQVGVNQRLILVKDTETSNVIVMRNPSIVRRGVTSSVRNEGCLSYPGKVVSVPRSIRITVRYEDIQGVSVTEKFSDYTARIIQHEIDHLNGITIMDRNKEYERTRL